MNIIIMTQKVRFEQTNSSRHDPQEFNVRYNNYVNCTRLFWETFENHHLEKIITRPDINKVCFKELESLRSFASDTGLRYENIVQDVDGHISN